MNSPQQEARLCPEGNTCSVKKGQIVIPKEARTVFGIQPGDTLLVLGDETRGIVVTRPEVMRDVAARIFDESDES